MKSGSRSSIFLGSSRLARTGISVIDRIIEPARAQMTVSAIGRNSLPFDPFQRQDRQIDDHDDEFAEECRLADLDRGFADHLELGLARQIAMGDVADAVLDHDYGAVHDHAEVDSAQAEQARRDAETQHAGEGEQHRQRDGQGDDARGPQVAQEEEQHRDDEQAGFEEVLAHRVDDEIDQLRAVVYRLRL